MPFVDSAAAKKYKRSPALIGVMSLFIIMSVISIASTIGGLTGNIALANMTLILTLLTGINNSIFFIWISRAPYMIFVVLTIAVSVFQIYLCIRILGLNKRAFKIYAGMIVARGILNIMTSISWIIYPAVLFRVLTPYLVIGLLLFLVYKADGRHFGGSALIDEPVSAKIKYRRLEKGSRSV
jgi:hypothetical protein